MRNLKDGNIEEGKGILIIQQLAEYLRLNGAAIYGLAQEGKIPGLKLGRVWRFDKKVIDEWFQKAGEKALTKLGY